MSLVPEGIFTNRHVGAISLWLSASLALAMVGNVSVNDGDSFQQPALRAVFLVLAFGSLVLAARRAGLSVSATWRFFPTALLGFLLWCGASILWSVSGTSTALRITESSATFLYLQSFVFIAALVCDGSKEFARLVAISIVAAVLAGLMINAILFGTPMHYWFNPDVPERPRFTFGFLHPLATGDILAIGILAALFAEWQFWWKVLVVAGLSALLLLTDSTGARFAILGIVPLVILLNGDDQAWRWTKFLAASLAIAVGALVFINYFYDAPIVGKFDQQNERLLTLTGRVTLWKTIVDNGLATTGFGFGFDASRYMIGPLVGRAFHAHNQFLNTLVESGMVGLALFAVLVASWIWRLVKTGGLFPVALCVYVLLLSVDNPGIFTKFPIMLAFMMSYSLPLFFPRQQPLEFLPMRVQNVHW
jgi:O-antigen ligase